MSGEAVNLSAYASKQWLELGPLETIPRRGARVVWTPQGNIAVFRTTGDDVFALRDQCPHRGGPLSQGIVHGNKVACPLHDWNVHLDSGLAAAPDEGCVARYPVRVENGVVLLGTQPLAAAEGNESITAPCV